MDATGSVVSIFAVSFQGNLPVAAAKEDLGDGKGAVACYSHTLHMFYILLPLKHIKTAFRPLNQKRFSADFLREMSKKNVVRVAKPLVFLLFEVSRGSMNGRPYLLCSKLFMVM